MDKRIAYARILIKGQSGYELLPSKANPRVKRWMKLLQGDGVRGKASITDPDEIEKAYRAYLKDPEGYRKLPPAITQAMLEKKVRMPYDQIARLSNLQAAAWTEHGGVNDLLRLIEAGQTGAGQYGPDHLALMEYLWAGGCWGPSRVPRRLSGSGSGGRPKKAKLARISMGEPS